MSQETQVFEMDAARGRALSDALTRAGYQFRRVPHARFGARGEGVSVTLYESGKLVLQGQGLELWASRFLGERARPAKPGHKDAPLPEALPAMGSDEAGKGDTFGGIVVAAVALTQEAAEALGQDGITDSKALSDARILRLSTRVRDVVGADHYAEAVLDPEEYNRRHAACGSNVNRLLAELHADLLAGLHGKTGIAAAVVDRFASDRPVGKRLRAQGLGLQVEEVPRAERHPAVAAASVLARDRFVESIRRLSDHYAVDLPLGSGAPVGPALRRFLSIHGEGALAGAAKLHFRNVKRMLGSA